MTKPEGIDAESAQEPSTPQERLLWAIFCNEPCDYCGMYVECQCDLPRGLVGEVQHP